MDIFDVLSLIGGLCLFLFGMNIMGQALERRAGGKLRSLLGKLTTNKMAGLLTGLGVTAIIQSSSATTVMVVGFVNSGLMTLKQAINVIMGANIGTTVTAWILSLAGIDSGNLFVSLLKPSSFTPVLALIGIIFCMFSKKSRRQDTGLILLGFATLMYGMDSMSAAVSGLRDVPEFQQIILMFHNPFLGVLAGAVFTAIIQSSSASVGILQALSSTGQVTIGAAIPIIMGQNIGTCATALISSVGANKNARRAAMVHLYFNIIGVGVFLVLFYSLNAVFRFTFVNDVIAPWGIAVVHSVFNLGTTALLLPFTSVLEKLACMTIPDDEKKESFTLLDERLLNTPSVAVEQARAVTSDMAETARTGVIQAMSLTHHWDDSLAKKVKEQEKQADRCEDALGTYLVKLSGYALNHEDGQQVNTLLHTISDFERISDYSVNLLHSAQEIHDKKITFSADAQEELGVLEDVVQDLLNRTTEAFRQNDLHLASKVEPMESVVNELVRAIKARHIARLQAGSCSITYGFVLDDLLTSYSRISAHCSNVAVAQIEVAQDSFDTHAYLSDLRHNKAAEESKAFQRRVDRYRARYTFPNESGAAKPAKKEEP